MQLQKRSRSFANISAALVHNERRHCDFSPLAHAGTRVSRNPRFIARDDPASRILSTIG
jgi:hypothetical protein